MFGRVAEGAAAKTDEVVQSGKEDDGAGGAHVQGGGSSVTRSGDLKGFVCRCRVEVRVFVGADERLRTEFKSDVRGAGFTDGSAPALRGIKKLALDGF